MTNDEILNKAIEAEHDYIAEFGPMDEFAPSRAEDIRLAGLRAVESAVINAAAAIADDAADARDSYKANAIGIANSIRALSAN